LSLDLTWNKSSSIGDYLYNSKRNDIALNATYNLGERLSFNTSYAVQKVTYVGSTGGTSSNMMFFNIHSKPIGKLTSNLSFQTMKTTSSIASTSTDTTGTGTTVGTTYSGTGGTNLNAYMFRLEYPVWRNNNLFFQTDNATNSGFLASTQRTMTMGIDFDLLRNTRFTLGWRSQQSTSHDTTSTSGDYNYSVSSLDADLNWHF